MKVRSNLPDELKEEFAFVWSDGDITQCAAAVVRQVVKWCTSPQARAIAAKHNASRSLAEQACDTSPIFKDSKRETLYDIATLPIDSDLKLELQRVLAFLPKPLMDKVVLSILKLMAVTQKVFTTTNIASGFVRNGQVAPAGEQWMDTAFYRLFNSDGNTQVSSGYQFTKLEEEKVRKDLPKLIKQFNSEGQISDAFLDSLNYPRSPELTGVDKSECPDHRKRVIMFNHEALKRQRRKKREEKELLEAEKLRKVEEKAKAKANKAAAEVRKGEDKRKDEAMAKRKAKTLEDMVAVAKTNEENTKDSSASFESERTRITKLLKGNKSEIAGTIRSDLKTEKEVKEVKDTRKEISKLMSEAKKKGASKKVSEADFQQYQQQLEELVKTSSEAINSLETCSSITRIELATLKVEEENASAKNSKKKRRPETDSSDSDPCDDRFPPIATKPTTKQKTKAKTKNLKARRLESAGKTRALPGRNSSSRFQGMQQESSGSDDDSEDLLPPINNGR